MFKVRLEDGRRGRLAQEPDGSWTLAQPADGVVNDPSRVCAEDLADGRAWPAVEYSRRLPKPAEAAAGSDSLCTACGRLNSAAKGGV
jgi:hypothetical protein